MAKLKKNSDLSLAYAILTIGVWIFSIY